MMRLAKNLLNNMRLPLAVHSAGIGLRWKRDPLLRSALFRMTGVASFRQTWVACNFRNPKRQCEIEFLRFGCVPKNPSLTCRVVIIPILFAPFIVRDFE